MTGSTITYTSLELDTLPIHSFDIAPKFKPELTRLDQGQGKSPRHFYPYRVCYLDRRTLDSTINSLNERRKVNLSSLCAKRVSLIQPIIKGLLEGHSSIPKFNLIECALDWIDEQRRSEELYSLEGARRLYRDYTDIIHHRLRLSNVGDAVQSIGFPMAQKLQSALAYVCAQACGHDIKVVQSWAKQIPQRKIGLNELPAPATTADEHALAYALHQRFFETFSQAVLNRNIPPVVVKLADLGFEDLIFYNQAANNAGGWSTNAKGGRADWQPFFYRREGVFEGKPKAFNALLAEHFIMPIKANAFRLLQSNNRHFSQSALRDLANHATRHFGHLLMAETGNNATHLASINCQKIRLDKAVGLATTRAIKGRAGFEQQEQHMAPRFAHTTWKQYLKLRAWMTEKLEAPPELGLFLLDKRSDRAPYHFVSGSSLPNLPLWPKGAPSLATRSARKHKTVNLLEGSSGNTALVAGMQYVTTGTIDRHYAFKNREEAAKIMSDYFTAQAKSAELRHLGIKPVRIIENGNAIHTGFCDDNEDRPRLLEGYEDIGIEPRCGAPITCIFCVNFGIHADIEDVLRLLTIKLWVETQSRFKSINIDEHFQKFAPFLNRLQQILDELLNMSGEVSKRAIDALTQFEQGERDPYWRAKINALLDMEGT